jgi:hypothetical protein
MILFILLNQHFLISGQGSAQDKDWRKKSNTT